MKTFCENDLNTLIALPRKVIIYGAGVMGKALMTCLSDTPYSLQIKCFLVENMDNNPVVINSIPVIDLEHAAAYKDETILVALHEKHLTYAMETLRRKGFINLVPVSFDSDLWSSIRWNWFNEHRQSYEIAFTGLEDALNRDLHIYIVHSIADKTLKEQIPIQSFEIPIQVGAALTDKKLFSVNDSKGENISEKNPQYCELTALYWIWKHDTAKYVGLSHYRRRFEIDQKMAEQVVHSDIDIITTTPVLNFAGVKQQYCNDHGEKDWDIMMDAVKEIHPEYVDAALKVQNGIYYYAYNMFIARREILNNYCEWLFPVLLYCENKIGSKTDRYQNRYIGFLSERLFTIYMAYNKQYKLAVARKHFIESI